MNSIKGMKLDNDVHEFPAVVKRGSDDEHVTQTTAENDTPLGVVTRRADAGDTVAVHPLPMVTRLVFDGACATDQEVALSGTTAGRVQDVANAGAGATIVGKHVDDYDAEDGDAKDCVFYGVGSFGSK